VTNADPQTFETDTPRRVRVARSFARVRTEIPLVVLDAVLVSVAYVATMLLRFDLQVPEKYWQELRGFLPAAVVVYLSMSWWWGLYREMWLHASIREARRVVLSCASAALVLGFASLLGLTKVPISVLVVGPVLSTLLLGALRFQSRLFGFRRRLVADRSRRVLVVGAGNAAAGIARDMLRNQTAGLKPVGFLDDNPRTHGRLIAGVPVLGAISELATAAAEIDADQALLAIPTGDQELVTRVAQACEALGLALTVLPRVDELVGGQVSVRDVRELRIEDLLGRQQARTDLDSVRKLLHGKTVLITGAGGSIGSEITRQVAEFSPGLLLLLDHDETHLHDAVAQIDVPCVQLLVDIRDRRRLAAQLRKWRPDVVFHAAANKHVPVLEDHPSEALATNVIGTRNIVDASLDVGVERFVLISTDKAVRASSVMGASKRLAEHLVLSAGREGKRRYSAVRFGNVLGSRGSVIPTFARQIASGGPVTVTDPAMTRYFISTQEAVQLVLQAAAFSDGGELFMLDMGQPINVLELARRMIRLSGRTDARDIRIEFTGVRPGEKLVEELQAPNEKWWPTAHESIVRVSTPTAPRAVLEPLLELLDAAAIDGDDKAVATTLVRLANDEKLVSTAGFSNALDLVSVDDTLMTQAVGGPSWNPAST
jgi:FlaA1/EpsC-like NDP-sugar epimerase